MLRKLWGGADRRRFPRLEAALDVEVQVEVYGFEGESRPFFASGRTINVSRSGVLARLDAPVTRGSVCNVFFRDTGDQVRPHHAAGRVVRCGEDDESFFIAVQFDEPLLRLEVGQGAIAAVRA